MAVNKGDRRSNIILDWMCRFGRLRCESSITKVRFALSDSYHAKVRTLPAVSQLSGIQ